MSTTPAPAASAREPGFYFVRFDGFDDRGREWMVAKLSNNGRWYLPANPGGYFTTNFAEIGPRIPSPDEARPAPAEPPGGVVERLTAERDGEREERMKLVKALAAKDAAMGELFRRLGRAGVDCSDLVP